MKNQYVSIKQKLFRIFLTTSGIVLLLTCSAFFAYEFFTFRQTTKEQLSTLGKIISANSTAALAFESKSDAYEILNALQAEEHIIAACLYNDKGEVFAHYPLSLAESSLPPFPGIDGYEYKDAHLGGFEPIIQQDQRMGTLYIRSDLKGIYKRFWLYSMLTLFVSIVVTAVAYFVSRRMQKTVSGPILALAQIAGTVSRQKDYTVRATRFSNDELGELTEAFNHMLGQIERQNEEITSFNQALEKKVTERTSELALANAALQLQNELIQTIFDSSIDMIAVLNKDLAFVMINRFAQKVYDVNPEQVLGRNILEIFPMLKGSQIYTDLKECIKGKVKYDPCYKSYGSNKILEIYYIPLLNKEGMVYNVLAIGHDITQITEANEKLNKLNDELGKSNRDLEQFAYVASHDLQEPLRKIKTYSTMLQVQMDDKAAMESHIAKIISSSERMSQLIRSILNYSQVSHSKGKFEKVDLNEIIENIKVDYEVAIFEKEAVIVADQLPAVQGDKLQLSQLFLNLISNSLKFSTKQPRVHISYSIVQSMDTDVKMEDPGTGTGGFIKIIVEDNGIGFEHKYTDRVFTIFQRLHSKKEYPGTGIGLALCKKIVDNHHGRICVNSVPGKGTAFDIYLPLLSR